MTDHHNDRAFVPGQRQPSQAAAPDTPATDTAPPSCGPDARPPRLRALRAWWTTAWADGGVLHARWEEVRLAPLVGWHQMATWIKAVAVAAGLSTAVLLVCAAAGVLAGEAYRLLSAAPRAQVGDGTSSGGGLWAVIDQPVRSYITAHSAGLPVSASTVYTLWLATGATCLVAGFCIRSAGVRLTWTAWGAASTAMVWSASPAASRTIAAGITVLAWTAASMFALRGLTLRPYVFTHVHSAPEIRPVITVPANTPPGGVPDNVTPMPKR